MTQQNNVEQHDDNTRKANHAYNHPGRKAARVVPGQALFTAEARSYPLPPDGANGLPIGGGTTGGPQEVININTKLLGQVSDSELFLLIHLADRMDKERKCFPSNKTLCNDLGWSMGKLQAVKDQLVSKGLLRVDPRSKEKGRGQTSNLYWILTPLINLYTPTQKLGRGDVQELGRGHAQKPGTPPTQKPGNEVLPIEVLPSEALPTQGKAARVEVSFEGDSLMQSLFEKVSSNFPDAPASTSEGTFKKFLHQGGGAEKCLQNLEAYLRWKSAAGQLLHSWRGFVDKEVIKENWIGRKQPRRAKPYEMDDIGPIQRTPANAIHKPNPDGFGKL